jgi:hypothetical protein
VVEILSTNPEVFNDRIPEEKLRVPLKMFFKKQTAGSPPQIMNDVFIYFLFYLGTRFLKVDSSAGPWQIGDWLKYRA